MEHKIINHGPHYQQYFYGCGTYGSAFENVVTGCDMDAKEAYEDALDQMAQIGIDVDKMPIRPGGIRRRDKVPVKAEDCYWYVSIRY